MKDELIFISVGHPRGGEGSPRCLARVGKGPRSGQVAGSFVIPIRLGIRYDEWGLTGEYP